MRGSARGRRRGKCPMDIKVGKKAIAEAEAIGKNTKTVKFWPYG